MAESVRSISSFVAESLARLSFPVHFLGIDSDRRSNHDYVRVINELNTQIAYLKANRSEGNSMKLEAKIFALTRELSKLKNTSVESEDILAEQSALQLIDINKSLETEKQRVKGLLNLLIRMCQLIPSDDLSLTDFFLSLESEVSSLSMLDKSHKIQSEFSNIQKLLLSKSMTFDESILESISNLYSKMYQIRYLDSRESTDICEIYRKLQQLITTSQSTALYYASSASQPSEMDKVVKIMARVVKIGSESDSTAQLVLLVIDALQELEDVKRQVSVLSSTPESPNELKSQLFSIVVSLQLAYSKLNQTLVRGDDSYTSNPLNMEGLRYSQGSGFRGALNLLSELGEKSTLISSNLEAHIERRKKESNDYQAENERLNKTYNIQRTRIAVLEGEINKLKSQLDEARSNEKDMVGKLSQIYILEAELEQRESLIRNLQLNLETANSEKVCQHDKFNKILSENIQSLNQEIAKLKESNRQQIEELTEIYLKNFSEERANVIKTKEELKSTKASLEQLTYELKVVEISFKKQIEDANIKHKEEYEQLENKVCICRNKVSLAAEIVNRIKKQHLGRSDPSEIYSREDFESVDLTENLSDLIEELIQLEQLVIQSSKKGAVENIEEIIENIESSIREVLKSFINSTKEIALASTSTTSIDIEQINKILLKHYYDIGEWIKVNKKLEAQVGESDEKLESNGYQATLNQQFLKICLELLQLSELSIENDEASYQEVIISDLTETNDKIPSSYIVKPEEKLNVINRLQNLGIELEQSIFAIKDPRTGEIQILKGFFCQSFAEIIEQFNEVVSALIVKLKDQFRSLKKSNTELKEENIELASKQASIEAEFEEKIIELTSNNTRLEELQRTLKEYESKIYLWSEANREIKDENVELKRSNEELMKVNIERLRKVEAIEEHSKSCMSLCKKFEEERLHKVQNQVKSPSKEAKQIEYQDEKIQTELKKSESDSDDKSGIKENPENSAERGPISTEESKIEPVSDEPTAQISTEESKIEPVSDEPTAPISTQESKIEPVSQKKVTELQAESQRDH